ncbi:HNH endonuclease [Candidatus Pacearchaeota archaeon]|nr:HNH endonuclease [Candidatus Pacearchaeota archaeon]
MAQRINVRNGMRAHRRREATKNGTLDRIGIGRGGGQKAGKESPHYKNGTGIFFQDSRRIKADRKFCERCGKDLRCATRHFWCVHHRDHDRTNNCEENYELLCKSCHQTEHGAAEHLNSK